MWDRFIIHCVCILALKSDIEGTSVKRDCSRDFIDI